MAKPSYQKTSSPKMSTVASKALQSKQTSKLTKSLAARVLSQSK
ncbi:hypothetical protein [Paenibacillus sp. VTT E-133280]|nr:hypothetical protein [Paenibacillus sp. VTT E-133280]